MIEMKYVIQRRKLGKGPWEDFSEFATKKGAAIRVLGLRKWYKRNKYRVKIL